MVTHSPIRDRVDVGTPRLIIASNRGPIEHYLAADGDIRQRQAGGGVAVALRGVAESTSLTWIAAACGPGDEEVAQSGDRVRIGADSSLRLLSIPTDAYQPYYREFCNPLLWFVQHGLANELLAPSNDAAVLAAWQEGYVRVNRVFADAIIDEVQRHGGAACVMLHDYHLYLAPRMIREACPNIPLQQFVHIPWPEPDAWAALPTKVVREICSGLSWRTTADLPGRRERGQLQGDVRRVSARRVV